MLPEVDSKEKEKIKKKIIKTNCSLSVEKTDQIKVRLKPAQTFVHFFVLIFF
jgi:hypothetical protein